MAVSDDLSKLSVRAKEAEDRVTAAQEKAKADLEEDRDFTRTAVEKQNAVLRELASESKGYASLDAAPARMEANELSKQAGRTA
jgi:uncharacterized protein YPO0396